MEILGALPQNKHNNITGLLSNACLGNQACQDARDAEAQAQALNQQLLQQEMMRTSKDDDGIPTSAIIAIVVVSMLFLGGIVYFTVIKKR